MPYFAGLYSGVKAEFFDCNDPEEMRDIDKYLDKLVGGNKADSIVSLAFLPSAFCNSGYNVGTQKFSIRRPMTYIDGHLVRNKKLFSYPYCFLNVDCCNDSKEFRWEWFYDSDPIHSGELGWATFIMAATTTPSMEIACIPYAYNSFAYRENNVTEELVMSGFPECPYTIDTYRAWLAQRSNILSGLKIAGTMITTAATVAGAAVTGNPLAGIAAAAALPAGVASIGAQVTKDITDATRGSRVRGALGCNIDVAHRVKNFYFKGMMITRPYAEALDDYFDRYGYACRKLKIPNRNVRPHWTYTQTKECTIRGAVPTDAMSKINSIYNNGITFWRNASEVGNYSLDNSPV